MAVAVMAKRVNRCVMTGVVEGTPTSFRTSHSKTFGLNFCLAVRGDDDRVDLIPFSVYGNLAVDLSTKLKEGANILVEASVRSESRKSSGKGGGPRLYLLLEKIVPIKQT